MDIAFGHTIAYGATMSGKTYFIKHLLNKLAPVKVFVFAGQPYQWSDAGSLFSILEGDFDDECEELIFNCKEHMENNRKNYQEGYCPFVIVFDDYNTKIDTNTNKQYKDLFTQGRHSGIRTITMAHSTKSVGVVARANSRYIIMSCRLQDSEIREIAKNYYENKYHKLAEYAETGRHKSQWCFLMLDKDTREVGYEVAPEKTKPINSLLERSRRIFADQYSKDIQPRINLPQTYQVDAPLSEDSMILNDPSDTLFTDSPYQSNDHSIQTASFPIKGGTSNNSISFGNKFASNMVDNSVNHTNIEQKINNDQRVQANIANYQMKQQNIIMQEKIDLQQAIINGKNLIYKVGRTPQEIAELVSILNKTLRPKQPLTYMDYHRGIPRFMEVYHGVKYAPDKKQKTVEAMGDIYTIAKSGDAMTSTISLFSFGKRLLGK